MHINLFLIPFVILLGLFLGNDDTATHRKWYIILCSAVLVFVAAMRHPEYMYATAGIDAAGYKNNFEELFAMGWSEIWENFIGRYENMDTERGDVGFNIFTKLISLLTHDFYIYSMIADLIFFVPFGIILYRFSTSMKQIIFAFVFYIALIQIFLLSGARQIIAIGFDLMALLSVINRKGLLSVIFFSIGLTFHFSSFLFAGPLLMIWYGTPPKVLKLSHVLCLATFPLILLMPKELIVFMGNFIKVERYADYGRSPIAGGASTFIFLIEMLSLFIFLAVKERDIVKSRTLQIFYVMAPLFTIFAPLLLSDGAMIRVSLYFHLFLVVLFPLALDCMFVNRGRNLAYVITIGLLSILTLKDGGTIYYFYWQL